MTEPDLSVHDSRLDPELSQAVAELPEAYKQVILMRFYGGQSCAEIGRNLGVSLGTVTSRLSRAYALLREALRTHEQRCGGRAMTCSQCEDLFAAHVDGLLDEAAERQLGRTWPNARPAGCRWTRRGGSSIAWTRTDEVSSSPRSLPWSWIGSFTNKRFA